jgi:hypothetical protein
MRITSIAFKSRKEIFICRGEADNFGRNSEIGGFFLTYHSEIFFL